jgi:cytochrome c-type biogenesis protein CcmE
VSLEGKVVGPIHGRGYSDAGLRFRVKDIKGSGASAVPVVYHGSVPDLFKADRVIVVDGRFEKGVFVAQRDTLVTKCPSKYTPAKSG